ncbi:MAG: hypothetical protein V3U58_03865 [Thermodesulfobacteriota bacterium]
MLQMRWVKSRENADTPQGIIVGWPENGNNHYILQFRDVVEIDQYGDVVTATEWKTVEAEES